VRGFNGASVATGLVCRQLLKPTKRLYRVRFPDQVTYGLNQTTPFDITCSRVDHLQLAKNIADLFAPIEQVEAVVLGGSRGSLARASDTASDVDLYVYTRADVPLEARRSIIERSGGSIKANLDLKYWGLTDVWINAMTGVEIDVMYFDTAWIEDQIERVISRHQPSLGYTTCFWYTICNSVVLSSSSQWFAALQNRCRVAYPETLRKNIIELNHPVLRGLLPAYANQLDKAATRHDLISINHRLAALFASYFDIIFAFNRQLLPGEKRLLELTVAKCAKLPEQMETDIAEILRAAAVNVSALSNRVAHLLNHLDQLLG
jgi:hypothetical protein